MARTFRQKHYIAIAAVIREASVDYAFTQKLDVICDVMLAFVERFKADSSEFNDFDAEEFKQACRGMNIGGRFG
jgi:hypothetical protein